MRMPWLDGRKCRGNIGHDTFFAQNFIMTTPVPLRQAATGLLLYEGRRQLRWLGDQAKKSTARAINYYNRKWWPYPSEQRRASIMPYRYRRRYPMRRYARRSRGRYRGRYSRRKRYVRRVRRVGLPTGIGSAKRALVANTVDLPYNTRTLYSRDITSIDKTTTNDINDRQRDVIKVSGFKIECNFRGSASATEPHIVHFAVIAPLATLANDSVPVGSVNAVPDTNFFRGNGASRAINFAITLSSMQMHSLNINADNYVVLKRWRKTIGEADSTTGKGPGQYKKLRAYVKLNRQVRYDTENYTANATQGRVFLVWWLDTYVGGVGAPVSNQLVMDQHIVTYFREPL